MCVNTKKFIVQLFFWGRVRVCFYWELLNPSWHHIVGAYSLPRLGERYWCSRMADYHLSLLFLSGSHVIHRIDGFDCGVVQVNNKSNPFYHHGVAGRGFDTWCDQCRLPFKVACGQDHSLFLTETGKVFACGWGADGQTGQYPGGMFSVHQRVVNFSLSFCL